LIPAAVEIPAPLITIIFLAVKIGTNVYFAEEEEREREREREMITYKDVSSTYCGTQKLIM
jgi:hypothetical protein